MAYAGLVHWGGEKDLFLRIVDLREDVEEFNDDKTSEGNAHDVHEGRSGVDISIYHKRKEWHLSEDSCIGQSIVLAGK